MEIKCHFPPNLNGNLKIIGFCKPSGGMSCNIACRDDSALMAGPNATTCLPPGLWSFVKPCTGGKSYCSAPKFHHIDAMEYCSGKEVGSTCQMRCKYRPSMKFSIICTNEVTWSTPPNCTCPTPVLKEGIELKENCGSKQVGQKCNVRCKSGFTMVGAGVITCNAMLQWSPLPLCKKVICPKPKLTSVLMFNEDCSAIQAGKSCSLECKEGGKLLHHSKINCINGKHWTKLPACACPPPALDEDLETKNGCNEKAPGQKCSVSCRGRLFLMGKDYIVCQNNTRWSTAPRCKRKLCHKPILTDILIFDEDCSSKQPGQRCRMACKNLGSLVGPTFIVCSNATRWSPLPTCSCPPPILPNFLEAKGNCRRKLPGESCPLSCTDEMKVEGDAIIKCQDDGHWSPLPKCKENICTRKQLPRYLVHSTDCTAIPPGEKCFLECKEGGEIEGNDFITCIGGSQWTAFPRCRCPAPKLSYYLSTRDDCSRKRMGEKCHLRCNERHQLAGNNFITCQNNTIWSPLPKCIRNLCLKQKLPSFLIYAEDCSTKIPGEKCRLECVEGGAMIGRSSITCINGTKWSSLPKCACPSPNLNERLILTDNCSKKLIGEKCVLKCIEKFSFSGENFTKCLSNTRWSPLPMCTINFCTRPKLPNELSYAEDCTSKVPGESCLLECTGEGELVGSNKITCINTSRWDHFPKCTCPAPDLEEDLSTTEDCRKKLIGEKCRVTCKGSLELLGSNLITCQQNSRWSSPPRCKRLICTKPKLNSILSFNEDCTSKSLNEKCELECREGGQIIGSKFITCLKRGRDLYWTAFPQCTCGDPFMSEELKLLENCHGKKPGESCKVNCTDRLTIILGGLIIRCQNNTKWTHMPKCVLNICMKPTPPAILEIQEDCSSKIVGESCRLKCSNGGMLQNTSQISCSESRTWTPFPKCTCPPITLSDDVKLLENCSAKLPGETCRAACISSLFKMNTPGPLTCKNDSKWSFQPRCTKMFCSRPILPEYLVFKRRCSNTSIGSVCSLSCAQKGRLTGDDFIKCMNGSLWSKFPDCTCSKPVLPKSLRSTHNCDFIGRGGRCSVKCEDGLKINGNDFILCENNTKWSSLPKCVQTLCPAPTIKSGIIKLKEDCSKKTVADKCELACIHGGNIIGNKYIECRNNFRWTTDLPDCTCKTPSITEGAQLAANCSFKKRSERCVVSCKEGYKLIGRPYIICQNNLSWSSLPQCKIIQCRIPILRNTALKFTVNCINKTYGAICRLNCAQGGKLIGGNFIKCMKTGAWSSLPDCTCSPPTFSNGLKAKQNCTSIRRGRKCHVECEKEFRLRGNDFILCRNDSTWSQKPLCNKRVCPKPVISSAISFVNGNCSGISVGDECRVRCRFGGKLLETDRAKCLPNETWSSFPDCTCNPPTLTSDIVFKENCTFKRRNDECAVACKEGSKHRAVQYITCENHTKWSALPTCEKDTCPFPILTYLKMEEDCSQKTAEEVCRVSCKENGTLIGRAFMKCLKNMGWGPIPDCTCAPPILNADLKTKEDCGFKRRDENCSLQCKNDKLRLQGSDYILCQNSTKWTEQPRCISLHCPTPILDGGILMLKENCSKKAVGEECQVYCKHGGMVLGHDRLKCLSNKTWSSLPDCTCPAPKLKSNSELKDSCNLKKRNEKCAVTCTGGSKTLQNTTLEYIICQNNAKWSSAPECKKNLCKIPDTSEARGIGFNSSCVADDSGWYGTGSCLVYCVENGMIIGSKQVRCLENQTWSEFPECSCPTPVLPRFMKTAYDCSFVRRGGLCHLWCDGKDLITPRNSFITCQNNSKWSRLPRCKAYCRVPDFMETNVMSVTACDNVEVGERCFLRCRNGGKIIGSRNYTTCRSLNTWSPMPECTCYEVDGFVERGLHLRGRCKLKRVNQTCEVSCSSQDPEIHLIRCSRYTVWENLPLCFFTRCSSPKLDTESVGIVENDKDCSHKHIWEICNLFCRNGGFLKAGGFTYQGITCQTNLQWTKTPDCSCPSPVLSEHLEFLEDCSGKDIGEYCTLRCKGDLAISRSYILCREKGVWDPLPFCATPYCAVPNLAESIKYQMQEDCRLKRIGETCQLSCKKGGRLYETDFITCLGDLSWTTYPECLCPDPILSSGMILLEDCSSKFPFEFCSVGCEPGLVINQHYIICQEDASWYSVPYCFSQFCPLPALPEVVLDFHEDCTQKRVGEVCFLVCKGGGSADANSILCQIDLTWSLFPICNCPLPTLNEYLEIQEDCRNKKPYERCLLRCLNGYDLPKNYITCLNGYDLPKNYITCQENAQWEPLPSCVTPVCPSPVLSEVLGFAEDCAAKPLGDFCLLRCVGGGTIVGSDRIACTENFIWSQLPSCTCPLPILNEHLEMQDDCSRKNPNEFCLLKCRNGLIISKHYITCQINMQWEPLPICQRAGTICPPPRDPPYFIIVPKVCNEMEVGETCRLRCSQGGDLYLSDGIVCKADLSWSPWPICACPEPMLPQFFELQEFCSMKKPGDYCKIMCGFEQNLLRCGENGRWSQVKPCQVGNIDEYVG
ncbi:Sushi, von Willebrand factor type A, EGF and pentraxin domain-containing protein 1 [Araneus ventricosus]|uniref:Sushi, von Willebrand factor type A, EGF and pentraxin domain-containing protein 1 n=1 Tax=Araneus ventricosus TaxID=182803 RepID=A0A4Y2MP97_ARAVE|nr:Sushi, von Willebrand factor type A, EGF and pentraxin domain-containing protein 1 [Araneus ventricosus]